MTNFDQNNLLHVELQAALQAYFDTMYDCDLDRFDRIFHPCSSLFSSVDGVMILRPFAQYRIELSKRKTPKSVGQPRIDEILALSFLSSEIAFAQVRVRILEKIFVDNLNLLRIGNDWMIVAKIYHHAETLGDPLRGCSGVAN